MNILKLVHTVYGTVIKSVRKKSKHKYIVPIDNHLVKLCNAECTKFLFDDDFQNWLDSKNIKTWSQDYDLYYDGRVIYFGFNGSEDLKTEFYLTWGKQ